MSIPMVRPVPAAEPSFPLHRYLVRVARADFTPVVGQVTRAMGLLIESIGPAASVGEICEVRANGSESKKGDDKCAHIENQSV